MSDDIKTKAVKYASIATPFVAVALSRYGISSEMINLCITGACMIGLAVLPSALSKWGSSNTK